ncbi:retron system putative HNH endonuclease [Gimesia panareensis]|nr:retron system putative HNH endonuclease [Gimesia panareensis]
MKWVNENRELKNFSYRCLPTEVKVDLKAFLLKEQYFLCAYLGLSIAPSSSHIEHLKPQSECEPGEDVEYRNLVACFPNDGGNDSLGCGAPFKKSWWDEEFFVSPLHEDCERRFTFAWSGHIHPSFKDDEAAQKTIEKLGLDADYVRNLRRKAIIGFFGLNDKRRVTKKQLQTLIQSLDKPNVDGKLASFCFVLKSLSVRVLEG